MGAVVNDGGAAACAPLAGTIHASVVRENAGLPSSIAQATPVVPLATASLREQHWQLAITRIHHF